MPGQSWTVARFKGVKIRLHLTLLLILPYLTYVTASRFGQLASEAGLPVESLTLFEGRAGPLTWGALFAISLFGSVLLHEMAHVAVAVRQGARVRSIMLMMLGGGSEVDPDEEGGAQSPRKEAVMALAGPALSIGIALLGWLAWRRVPHALSHPWISFYGHWIFKSNLVLAIFNLLPAFPLDGGRALRASLSARIGPVRATRIAVRVSHGMAWALGALGLLGFNLFLVLIAFFLYASAQAEWSALMSRGLLEGLRAGEVATLVPSLPDGQSLSAAINQMLHSRVTALPVEHPKGRYSIVTLQQVRAVPFHFRDTTLLRDVVDRLTEDAETLEFLDWDTPLATALQELGSARHGILPVSRNGRIIGILRHSDLSEVLQLKSIEKVAA